MLLTGETSSRLTDEEHPTRPIDKVVVKGRVEPITVHQLLVGPDAQYLESREAFAEALGQYFAGRFHEAAESFKSLSERFGADQVIALFAKRCRSWEVGGVPKGWSGITHFESK